MTKNMMQYQPTDNLSVVVKENTLDINNIDSVTQFGQNVIARINIDNNKLNVMKSTGNSDVNNLVKDILDKVDDIDFASLQKRGFFSSLFKKLHLKKFIQKYNTIKESVDEVSTKLNTGQQACVDDIHIIEDTYKHNFEIIPQIDTLIEYGKQEQEKLNKIDTSSYEAFELQAYNTFCNQLTKKINTLFNIRNILSQELVQLKVMEENNVDLVNKINDINQYVLPLWKHNLSTILILENQSQNAKLIQAISDTTNKMIEIQSNLLYENSVAIANENERGIVDISTLKKSTDLLCKTLQDVNTIHSNAIKNQEVYENELNSLKDKIHNIYMNNY